jgi:uncharacterized protein YvpB
MKSTRSFHNGSSIWITITGVVLAILFCLLATSMMFLVFPDSSDYFKVLLGEGSKIISQNNASGFQFGQPTPFQPGPTRTPTATPMPEPTPVPAESAAESGASSSGSMPAWANVGRLDGSPQLYTLDCEAQAAVDWARFFGVNIDELEFIERLPVSDDPDSGFVGYINGPMGQLPPNDYGVHASPIADLLQEYGLPAEARHDWDFTSLKRELASGQPVIVWIVNMPFAIDTQEYTATNGNTTTVARYEHTWIVTGYNSSTVTVVDSAWTYNVKTATFMERWEALGKQAVVYSGD